MARDISVDRGEVKEEKEEVVGQKRE